MRSATLRPAPSSSAIHSSAQADVDAGLDVLGAGRFEPGDHGARRGGAADAGQYRSPSQRRQARRDGVTAFTVQGLRRFQVLRGLDVAPQPPLGISRHVLPVRASAWELGRELLGQPHDDVDPALEQQPQAAGTQAGRGFIGATRGEQHGMSAHHVGSSRRRAPAALQPVRPFEAQAVVQRLRERVVQLQRSRLVADHVANRPRRSSGSRCGPAGGRRSAPRTARVELVQHAGPQQELAQPVVDCASTSEARKSNARRSMACRGGAARPVQRQTQPGRPAHRSLSSCLRRRSASTPVDDSSASASSRMKLRSAGAQFGHHAGGAQPRQAAQRRLAARGDRPPSSAREGAADAVMKARACGSSTWWRSSSAITPSEAPPVRAC